jgi:hypothetical protein
MSDDPQVRFRNEDRQKIKVMFKDYTTLVDKGKDKEAKHLLHNIQSDIKNMTPR